MNLENKVNNRGFLGRIVKKIDPYIAAIGLSAMAMGCPTPYTPPQVPSTSTPSSQPPAEPSIVIYLGPNTTTSNPYTGSTQPQRLNQVLIYDGANDETSFTLERATGNGPFNPLATLPAGTQLYNDYNVTESTTYTYEIKANNNSGSSDWYTQTATSVGPQVGAINVHPSADTYISGAYPNTNFGSYSYVEIEPNEAALLQFPLPTLPSWAVGFNSASLTMYDASGGSANYTFPIEIRGELIYSSNGSFWNENTVTWDNSYLYNSGILASVYVSPSSSYKIPSITMDVSQIASDWYFGTTNNGLFLYVDSTVTPNGSWSFYSKEGYAPGSADLQIEYNW